MIDTLVIFAAGLGTRMRELAKDMPKTLINIANKPILHYVLELALSYPFRKIIINTHYLNEKIHESITQFKSQLPSSSIVDIVEVFEPELLDTGGAIKNIADLLENKPIFTINSDIIIKPRSNNLFEYLQTKWNAEKMDFLLLLQPFDQAIGYRGNGDFELLEDGKVYRPSSINKYGYMYAGLSILKPELIIADPRKIFSLSEYYLAASKVYGTVADFDWYHASSPEDIEEIRLALFNK